MVRSRVSPSRHKDHADRLLSDSLASSYGLSVALLTSCLMHSYTEDFDSCATAFSVVVSSPPQLMLPSIAHDELDPNTWSPLFGTRLGIPDGSFCTFFTHVVDQMTSRRDHSVQITSIASGLSDLILRVSSVTRSVDRQFCLELLNHRPLFK